MSRKRQKRAAARAKALAKLEQTRRELQASSVASLLAVYECTDEAVSSWPGGGFRRAG